MFTHHVHRVQDEPMLYEIILEVDCAATEEEKKAILRSLSTELRVDLLSFIDKIERANG